eukprot:221863-Pyramimonas_sp.AAC.1
MDGCPSPSEAKYSSRPIVADSLIAWPLSAHSRTSWRLAVGPAGGRMQHPHVPAVDDHVALHTGLATWDD